MAEAAVMKNVDWRGFVQEKLLMGMTVREYVRSLFNVTDLTIAVVLLAGIPVIVWRYVAGLGAVTHLTQERPWGLWISFDVASGVALAAGGYTVACAVYLFGQKQLSPIVRPAVLTGLLGYLLVILGLLVDLGKPWNLIRPIVSDFGTTSVMFELGWCVALYFLVLMFEFLPAVLEWLGLRKMRLLVAKASMGAIVLGVSLSTLHQSSLGSLFLMMPGKIHPLWYSPYLPFFFFISSIGAGIGMVIFESSVAHRAFSDQDDPGRQVDIDGIVLSLSKAGALLLFSYFFLKMQGVAASGSWNLLGTPMGAWFLVEVVGFVLVPSLMFACAARNRMAGLARAAAILTVIGIVLNRFNVSWLAFTWDSPAARYVPSAGEVLVSITIVTIGVALYRWIVNRMPVLHEHPDWQGVR